MKKLMIAAVAVALATVASAATTKWGFNTGTGVLKDGYKKDKDASYTPVLMASATMYLIDANMSYGGLTGQAALLKALSEGKSISTYAIQGQAEAGSGKPLSAVTATTDSSGQIKPANSNVGVFYREDLTGGTDKLSGFAAIVVGDYVYMGSTSEKAALANPESRADIGATSASSANYRGTSWGSAGWYKWNTGSGPEPTPEPTSGLLLLLGVAGLALRRKRA